MYETMNTYHMFKVALTTCCDLKLHTDVLNGTKVAFTFLWIASLFSQQERIVAMVRKRTFFLLNMRTFDATCPASVSPANTSEDLRVVDFGGQVKLLSSHFSL